MALERAIFLKSHLSKALDKVREEEDNPSRDSSFCIPSPWQILPIRLCFHASSTKSTHAWSELCLFSCLLYLLPNLRAFRARSLFCLYWSVVASDHINAFIKHDAILDSSVADAVVGRAVQHSLFVRDASRLCQAIISTRTSWSHPLLGYSSEFSQREIIYCYKYFLGNLHVVLFPLPFWDSPGYYPVVKQTGMTADKLAYKLCTKQEERKN